MRTTQHVEVSTTRRTEISFEQEDIERILREHIELTTDIPVDYERQEIRVDIDNGQVVRATVVIIDMKEGEE